MKFASRIGTTFAACLLGLAAMPFAWAQGFFPEAPNQRGLSGVWTDPDRPEQKIFLDVAAGDTGKGRLFGGWLGFDSSGADGPDAQLWYTFQAEVSDAEPDTLVTLYRSSQGRFDAPSPTTTETAGTAILHFDDCYSGSLRYTVRVPGSSKERQGTFALRRASPNLACRSPFGAMSAGAPAAALSGTWYQPATSGQGLLVSVGQREDTLSAGWFTYAGGTAKTAGPRWFTLQAALGTDVTHLTDVPIYAATGGRFDAGGFASSTRVGSAQVIFSGCNNARLEYRFDAGENAGLQGGIDLVRLLAQPCDDTALRIPGHVVAPDGVNPAELTALGAFSETTVDAQGNFVLPRSSQAPTLTGVVHPDGGVVQFGMLDAELAAGVTFDAHSSAVALLFQTIGGRSFTADQRRAVIKLIENDPATGAVTGAILAEQAKNPFVLDDLSPPILAAIETAVKGWLPSAATVSALRAAAAPLRALGAPFVRARSAAADAGGAADDGGAPQQLLLQNGPELSGFTLLLNDDNAGVTIQNSKRRPGSVRVFTTGFTDADGQHTDLPLAEEQGEKIPVPATRRLTTFSAIGSVGSLIRAALGGKDVAAGTIPWSPIDSGPIPVRGRDGAVTTDVDVVVLTGVWNGQTPALGAAYRNVADVLANDVFLLRAKEVIDATIMMLIENLGISVSALPDLSEARVVALLPKLNNPDFSTILETITSGKNYTKALIGVFGDASREAGVFQTAFSLAKEQFIEQHLADAATIEKTLAQRAANAATQSRNQLLNAGKRALALVSAIFAGIDSFAQGADQLNGDDVANVFHVRVVRPTVRLEPRDGKVNLGETLRLKVSVRGFEDDPRLHYSWTLEGEDQSLLDDLQGHRVAGRGSFDSDQREVSFITADLISIPGSAHTVNVQVFYRNSSGAYEAFGSVSASIAIDGLQVKLDPEDVTLKHGEVKGFVVQMNPIPADTSVLRYEWKTEQPGSCGVITIAEGASNSAAQPSLVSTHPSATYLAAASGSCTADLLTVTVFKLEGGVRTDLGHAEAIVGISPYDIALSPSQATLRHDGQRTFNILIDPLPPDLSALRFDWSSAAAGRCGTLTSAGISNSSAQPLITTQSAHATYAANPANASGCTSDTVQLVLFTLTDGVRTNLGSALATITFDDDTVTPVTAGPVQYYTTDRCSVAYVDVPKISGANYYRVTGVSGINALGNLPPGVPGGSTVTDNPSASVFVGKVYDVIDTPVAVSCAATGLSSTLIYDGSVYRLTLARALIIDGNPTPSWTAASEAAFRDAIGSAAIHLDAFHSDLPP